VWRQLIHRVKNNHTSDLLKKYGKSTKDTQCNSPIFKCQWVKYLNGVNVDKFGLTVVDLANVGHKDDTWVLANRVAQVFYVKDPSNLKKEIVLPGKQQILGVALLPKMLKITPTPDSMPLYP
jgi:hypothetical protein